jgi:hypothetical protein
MKIRPGRKAVALSIVVLFLLGGGVAGGQTAEPAWADELFVGLQDWSVSYNEQAEDVRFLGKSLVSGERVTLRVTDTDGSVALYSFGVDGQARVVGLQRGETGDSTFRLTTEKVVIDRIVAAENPARALENALLSGRIGVKKVFTVLGTPIPVGPVEAMVGAVGIVVGAALVAKFGLGGLSAKFMALIDRLKELLGGAISAVKLGLKALEMMGIDLREKVYENLWERLKARFRRGREEPVQVPTPEDEPSTDPEGAQEPMPR